MSITSYAQNFEDVMLWRALGHVPTGFYIDIGAQHPVTDSVSKAFYEKGWRGIHVEATPAYATLLRQDRPDETVIEAAVNDEHGVITFFEIPSTGISTGDREVARSHKERGFDVHEISVPCVTLADVFCQAGSKDIHWLKVDVEAMELQVLRSWGDNPERPWVVVVESTVPLTQTDNHFAWEQCLVERGYAHAYFDGLNRYYLAADQQHLARAFAAGPNVFDGFTLHGEASAPFCAGINEKHRQELAALQALINAHDQEAQRIKGELSHLQATQQTREQELTQRVRTLQETLKDLEHSYAVNELNWRHLSSQDIDQAQKQSIAHLQAFAEREKEQSSHLQALQAELRIAYQNADERARALQAEATTAVAQANAQAQTHLQALAQREQGFAQQMLQLQEQMQALQRRAMERERELQSDLSQALEAAHASARERESAIQAAASAELQNTTRQCQANLDEQQQAHQARERELQVEKSSALQQARAQLELHHQEWMQREQDHAHQLQALQDQLRATCLQAEERARTLESEATAAWQVRLEEQHQAYQVRERELLAENTDTLQQVHAQLELHHQEWMQREQDHAHQVQALQDQLRAISLQAEERARTLESEATAAWQVRLEEQRQAYQVRERELLAENASALEQAHTQLALHLQTWVQREQTLAQESHLSEQQHHQQHLAWAQFEKDLRHHIALLERDAQELKEAVLCQAQTHDAERRSTQATHQQQLDACAAAEDQLKTALVQEQQNMAQLAQTLEQVGRTLAATHATWSWRLTAPLRAFDRLRGRQPPEGLAAVEQPNLPRQTVLPQSVPAAPVTPTAHYSIQTSETVNVMPESTSVTALNVPNHATSVRDLLSRSGEEFIHLAYQALLGRAPDPEGFAYYLGRLHSGYGKPQILEQLRSSPEGRSQTSTLPGLRELLIDDRKSRHWFFRWFSQSTNTQRQLNRLEEIVGALHGKVHQGTREIETRLADLQQTLVALHAGQAPQGNASPALEVAVTVEAPPLADLSRLGQQAQRWARQLQQAQVSI